MSKYADHLPLYRQAQIYAAKASISTGRRWQTGLGMPPSICARCMSAVIASLIETCNINDVDPLAYLTEVLTKIVNGHPNREIDQLLPWAYRGQSLKAVA